MNFKVGVFANGQLSGDAITEAKKVLNELALKYKCRFEVSKAPDSADIVVKKKSLFNAKFKNTDQPQNGVFLSFCGELEL